jgi:hypothetical protein
MPLPPFHRILCAAVCLSTLAACGSSPSSPSGGNTGTNCSVIVGNKGTVTSQVNGSTFSGIAPTGSATQSQTSLSLFGQDTDNTTISVVTNAAVGTIAFGAGIVSAGTIQLQTRSCTAGTGLWVASIVGGNGTITVTSLTATGASGTFSGTLVAQAGSGASGTKTITNGQFNVTF